MNVLVVGLSHGSAPVAVLERAAPGEDTLVKLLHDVHRADDVAGCFVLSTCNRVEIYAEVARFHGGVSAICELLARHSGVPLPELTPFLYVHYSDRAVQHLLAVACGLDSMVVGESQILGQVRQALRMAREQETMSRALSEFGSRALRAGKRAHTETGIDRAGANLVSVGLAAAAERLRPGAASPAPLAGLSLLVVGAGSMSALAAATASRLGASRLVVANRTAARAERLAAAVSGASAGLGRLPVEIATADIVVSCTGARGYVITAGTLRRALRQRSPRRPLIVVDLALPRDVEPRAGELPGVTVIGLEDLRESAAPGRDQQEADIAAVRRIVAEEFAAHSTASRSARVAPTVAALREKAADVVEAELTRLTGRLGGLDDRARREIGQSLNRVAEKLLHAPTVRVKELAGSPGGDSYETALRVLFDLEPGAVEAVASADAELAWPAGAGQNPGEDEP
jgi:glutamyl-tRNA reductase